MVDRIDRIDGLTGSIAAKAPVKVATTGNIVLAGAQTIDGVALTADETPRQRVLVKDQTRAVDNGIYDVNSGVWSRSPDFNGGRDAVNGTKIFETNSRTEYYLSGTNPIAIGTDELVFNVLVSATGSVDSVNGETGAVLLTQDDILAGSTYVQTHNDFTDAEKAVLDNTSGTNTGDQVIPTISDVAYDATTWDGNTDGASKNAIRDKIESLSGGHDAVTLGTANGLSLSDQELSLAAATNSSPGAATAEQVTAIEANTAKVTNATHTGDATGSEVLTLATVNSNVGSFTNANVTVNAKGLVTAAATGTGGSGTELSVVTYGATGDGVTDDTSAIQDCFDAAGDGDTIIFPPPTSSYLISSPVSTKMLSETTPWPAAHVIIDGKGSNITLSGTGGFIVDGLKSRITDMYISGDQTTGQVAVTLVNSYCTIDNCYIGIVDTGILVTERVETYITVNGRSPGVWQTITNVKIRNCKTTVVELDNAVGPVISNLKYDTDTGTYSVPTRGLYLYSEGCNFDNIEMINAGRCVEVKSRPTPVNGLPKATSWNFFNNCIFDTSAHAIYAYSITSGQTVNGLVFDDCWFGTMTGSTGATAGVYLLASYTFDGVIFTGGCQFINSQSSAISLNGTGLTNVVIDGCIFSGNSSTPTGTYPSIYSNMSGYKAILNNTFSTWGGLANTQSADIERGSGDGDVWIDGNVSTSTVTVSNVVTASSIAPTYGVNFGGIPSASGSGSVTSVTSATSAATVATTTTTPVITIVSAPKLTTARTIAGVSFDGSANISLNNNAITNGALYVNDSQVTTNSNVAANTTHRSSSGSNHSDVVSNTAARHTKGSDTSLGAQSETLDMNNHNIDDVTSVDFYTNGELKLPLSTSFLSLAYGGTAKLTLYGNVVYPNSSNALSLGTSSYLYKEMYATTYYDDGGGYNDHLDDMLILTEMRPLKDDDGIELRDANGNMMLDVYSLPDHHTNFKAVSKEIEADFGELSRNKIRNILRDKKFKWNLARDRGAFNDNTAGAVRQVDIELREIIEMQAGRITEIEKARKKDKSMIDLLLSKVALTKDEIKTITEQGYTL